MTENANGLIKFVTKTELAKRAKKARKIERPELKLTEQEARERAAHMLRFLKLVHPGNDGQGFKKAIEIKFLLRGEGASYSFYKPTLLFNLSSESAHETLAQAIAQTSNFSHCCYYSLYNFDNLQQVRVETNNVTEHKTVKKIVADNVSETWTLAIDLDGVSEAEYLEHRNYLLKLGIETIGVFTGHGYQMLILLDKPSKLKNLYANFTQLLHKLIPQIDTGINAATQVFRMPYTLNCKEYSDQFKFYKPYDPEAKPVVVKNWTEKRYAKKWIFETLEAEYKKLTSATPKLCEKAMQKSANVPDKVTASDAVAVVTSGRNEVIMSASAGNMYKNLYSHVDYEQLPSHIQKILQGTTEGFRNKCVLYLTPFFNRVLGLTQQQAVETLEVFNNLCTPPKPFAAVKSDYYRFSEAYAEFTRGKYTEDMAAQFGPEQLDVLIRAQFDTIQFCNQVIKKFHVIHPSAVRLYLAMKFLEIEQQKSNLTIAEIALAAGVSEKSVQRYIPELTKHAFVLNVPGNNKKGIKKSYKINPYGQYINGFTRLSKLLAKDMLRELLPTQMVVYLYMLFKVSALNNTLTFASQQQMALDTALTQQAISSITQILQQKNYITKRTWMGKQKRRKTTYTLRNM